MSEFVKNFGDRERNAEPEPVFAREKCLEGGKFRLKSLPLDGDQQECRHRQAQAEQNGRFGKKPARFWVEPVENSFRVNSLEADCQYVR